MGRRIRGDERGQGLIELALVLPVLLLLLLGIVEFGLLLYNQHVITNASREGARFGIVFDDDRKTKVQITEVVSDYVVDNLIGFGSSSPVVDVYPEDTSSEVFGNDLRVDVTYHYDFLVLPAFISDLFGGMDLHAFTSMKYE